MRTFEDFFRHIRSLGYWPNVCLDVGAGYGTGSIYSAFPQAKHLVFEPLESNRPRLEKRLENLAHEIHICGLMSSPGTMTLTKMGNDDLGSSFMAAEGSTASETVEVPVHTLDQYFYAVEDAERVFLKVDCQGADLDVLKGGPRILERTDLIIVESSLFPFWGEHHPVLLEICSYMEEQDFVIYDFLEPTYRPVDGALGQIDTVFVKRNGFFRQNHAWGENKPSDSSDESNAQGEALSADLQAILNDKNKELSHLRNVNALREGKAKVYNELQDMVATGCSDEKLAATLRARLQAQS